MSSPSSVFPFTRFPGGVGIVAPSFTFSRNTLTQGLQRITSWDCSTWVDDEVYKKHRYFSGSDEVRARGIDRVVRNASVDMIWCARGGYGAARLLPLLEKKGTGAFLKKNPKLLLGYSDVTALHIWWNCHLGLPSVHCPMPGNQSFVDLPKKVNQALQSLLNGSAARGALSYTNHWPTYFLGQTKKSVEASIVGGNLTVLCSLVGTKFAPSLRGKILFLEDCAERPYRVDRMLHQLDMAGILSGIKGVLLGDFEADVEYKSSSEKKFWKEIFLERFEPKKIPILAGLPVGHCDPNYPLPFGVKMRITKKGKLEIV